MDSGTMMIRKKVQRKCKIRGYTLKVDALDEILSFVNRFQGAEDDALDLLLDHLLDHDSCIFLFLSLSSKSNLNAFSLLSLFVCLFSVKSSIIDREPVHRVVALLLEAEAAVDDDDVDNEATGGPPSSSSAIRVVDAFFVPKFRYDPIKKIFYEYVMSPSS